MIERVISGGQTGADRGGLDGAIAFWGDGTDRIGGWCPAGRRSEDGPIPARYPLQETEEWSYPPRTELNVREAEGSIVVTAGAPTPGSKLTLDLCEQHCKPHIHLDLTTLSRAEAVENVIDWADVYDIRSINVAGSRETTCDGIQHWTACVIHDVLSEIGAPK